MVLLRNYANLQYIVVDGGSRNGAVEIIKKYAPWIDYLVSEKDQGQSHAINKGLERCDGKWQNWINSDDYLLLGALQAVAQALVMALKMPDGVVCDQPLRPAAAAEVFINTLQRLDRAAKGK